MNIEILRYKWSFDDNDNNTFIDRVRAACADPFAWEALCAGASSGESLVLAEMGYLDIHTMCDTVREEKLIQWAGYIGVKLTFTGEYIARPRWYEYVPYLDFDLDYLVLNIPFESRTEARDECFMALTPYEYTYGVGLNARTYTAVPMDPEVGAFLATLNRTALTKFNACFFNRYNNKRQALGWHSDDSPEQDQTHPIAVLSLGATRELWTRKIGHKGQVAQEDRFKMEDGTLLVMPGGYQQTHQHRIPKADSEVGQRVSLTFRRLL